MIELGDVVAWREEDEFLPHSIGTVKQADFPIVVHWNYKNVVNLNDHSAFSPSDIQGLVNCGLFFRLTRVYKVVRYLEGVRRSAANKDPFVIEYTRHEPITGIENTPVIAFEKCAQAKKFRMWYDISAGMEIWSAYTPYYERQRRLCVLGPKIDIVRWWNDEDYQYSRPRLITPIGTLACKWLMLATRISKAQEGVA